MRSDHKAPRQPLPDRPHTQGSAGAQDKELAEATVPSRESSGWTSTGAGHMGELMAFFPSSWRSLTVKRKRKGKTSEYKWASMLAVETKRNQLVFLRHLTNIPKWLVAQKESEEKCPEPRIHSTTPRPRRRVPSSGQALPGCSHRSSEHMTKTQKLLDASRSCPGLLGWTQLGSQ